MSVCFGLRTSALFPQNFELQCDGCLPEIPVEGCERKLTPRGEFEISRIIARQTEAFCQPRDVGPRLVCGFFVELDRQCAQKSGQKPPTIGIQATAPLGDEERIQCFERPAQDSYLNLPRSGPFKPEHYRY